MTSRASRFFLSLAGSLVLAFSAFGQEPRAAPDSTQAKRPVDEQEPIRTRTEEVQLTVTALDFRGNLDPTLQLADILVLEDGQPQLIRSARRVPAHVLLLLDTGGELNSFKRVRLTREIARALITSLSEQDEILVMQFNSKIETLQSWTKDRPAVLSVLDTMLFPGKRARFFDAMIAAATKLRDRPQGNRHVVMITDGVQSPAEQVDRLAAVGQLQAANAVVHIISYTSVSNATMVHQRKFRRNRDKSTVPDDAVNSIGGEEGAVAKGAHLPGGVIFDLDLERRHEIKAYHDAMKLSEKQLAQLAEDSGGRMWLPESAADMIRGGAEAARLIDSQYVVTYKPLRELASAREGEVRRIEVASRRVGLQLISRRHYVVPANPNINGLERKVNH